MISMPALNRAYGQARQDLADVGLLHPDRYLDCIECMLAAWPGGWWNECGFVYDRSIGFFDSLAGFQEGVIYIPWNAPTEAYRPGSSLTDVVRHEFAHAWYWLDPRFVNGPWFRDAFGASYLVDEWDEEEETWDADEYVSAYAMTCPREDFAETFMTYLRCHRSLERFRGRAGVYRKLKAVEKAVKRAARERVASAPRKR